MQNEKIKDKETVMIPVPAELLRSSVFHKRICV